MNIAQLILGTITEPVSKFFSQREERKKLETSAKAKLSQTQLEGEQRQELTDAEWEVVAKQMEDKSWKDEYVTVSIVSVFNLIVLGGIASAFGYVQILQGMAVAINALVAAGVDVGFLLTATVLAALGLKVWRNR